MNTFFSWFGGVLNDPHDKQGSTKRVCLFIFLVVVLALISLVTWWKQTLPEIPDSLLYLICFMVLVFAGLMTAEKGIAAWKAVGMAKFLPLEEALAEQAKTEQESVKEAS